MTAPLDLAAIRARAAEAGTWSADQRGCNVWVVDVLAADVTALCDEVERLRGHVRALVDSGPPWADKGAWSAARDAALAALKGTP